jgi:hypothetical protein
MKYIVLGLIKFYRKFISPLFPPKCKYYPTCSTYALEAVRRFGAVRGSALAVWRILRCNPWSLGGVDHVPDKFTFRVKKYNFIDPDYGDDEDNEKIEG